MTTKASSELAVGTSRDCFAMPSTGEDFPDEWPMKDSELLKYLLAGWAPAIGVLGMAFVIGACILMPFSSQQSTGGATARIGSDPRTTGTVDKRPQR